ncbi:uncharacterized protein LOC116523995 [Thamnophis elegans]|uniref:uncharacterized protein LOC116523995 n=1 Tax=Thamnophis elegans TaxID=35005 RepID=UPI0013788F88|nr:uncharacterized protein LOC116523995 [Thamnophis elegans]
MQTDNGNNKRFADPSTPWGEGRPVLKDCHKICCTKFGGEREFFRPILYGCRLSCCNVKDYEDGGGCDVCCRQDLVTAKRSGLSQDIAAASCVIPGCDYNKKDSLTPNLPTGEETAEGSIEAVPGYNYDMIFRSTSSEEDATDDFPYYRRPTKYITRNISSEEEATDDFPCYRNPTKYTTSTFTEDINDDVKPVILKSRDYPIWLPRVGKRDFSNDDNEAVGCACGGVDCICTATTEVDEDDDDVVVYYAGSDDGYYSANQVRESML